MFLVSPKKVAAIWFYSRNEQHQCWVLAQSVLLLTHFAFNIQTNLICNGFPLTNIRQQCMKRWHVGGGKKKSEGRVRVPMKGVK